MSNQVSNFLGVAPAVPDDDQAVPGMPVVTTDMSSEVPSDKTVGQHDKDNVREKLYEMMNLGSAAAVEQFKLAQASQAARAFEVLAKTIDSVRALGKDLVDLNKNELPAPAEAPEQGTPAKTMELSAEELMELIKRRRNGG